MNTITATSEQIHKHQKTVFAIALSIIKNLPASTSIDDLVTAGNVGLIDAIEKYNPTMGATLTQYARIRIRGAIMDELRKMDHLSRSQRDALKKVQHVLEEFSLKHRRQPSTAEIAAQTGLSENLVDCVLRRYNSIIHHPISACSSLSTDDKRIIMDLISEKNLPNADVLIEQKEQYQALYAALEKIKPRNRRILYMYFFESLPMTEIAKKFDLTESRISQIVERSTTILKHLLKGEPAFED